MTKKKEIGRLIKTMRMSRGLTQAELAKRIHQSPSSITMYETGRREPDFETLEALADIFNVPLSALVDETEHADQSAQGTTIQIVHPEIRILAKGLDQLPEAERRKALAMARTIFDAYAYLFDEKGAPS